MAKKLEKENITLKTEEVKKVTKEEAKPKKKVYFVKKDRESCNRYNRNG